MINYIKGNLFTSNAKVLVNTVNTVGVMGKGIAADFKKIYPQMFENYKQLCNDGTLDIGELYLYKTSNKWILNFPTKKHWKSPSTVEYIEKGLQRLVQEATKLQITDIAMPKLGCGNGGLDWEMQVKPIVEKYLKKAPINVSIYDFDKDIVPEHTKPKDIEDWLRSDPESLTFSVFFEDLQDSYSVNTLFPKKIKLSNNTYEINYNSEEDYFLFQSKSKSFILSRSDIKTMFYTLKTVGKLCENDIYHELQEYKKEIFDFLSVLPYILKNEDKIVLNYTKKSDLSEVLDFDA
ncbi:macro domain-containing protein [bacterium]|nr:macro domain-containing protein [bacterium]MBU1993806.1 macro domain-containing protein [bacterium]